MGNSKSKKVSSGMYLAGVKYTGIGQFTPVYKGLHQGSPKDMVFSFDFSHWPAKPNDGATDLASIITMHKKLLIGTQMNTICKVNENISRIKIVNYDGRPLILAKGRSFYYLEISCVEPTTAIPERVYMNAKGFKCTTPNPALAAAISPELEKFGAATNGFRFGMCRSIAVDLISDMMACIATYKYFVDFIANDDDSDEESTSVLTNAIWCNFKKTYLDLDFHEFDVNFEEILKKVKTKCENAHIVVETYEESQNATTTAIAATKDFTESVKTHYKANYSQYSMKTDCNVLDMFIDFAEKFVANYGADE